MRRLTLAALFVAALIVLPLAVCFSSPTRLHVGSVPHLSEAVSGRVYQSGQPSEAGFDWLREHGFRSIVCLREEHDDGTDRMKRLGFGYLYLPMPDYGAPTPAQAESFLQFVSDPGNWPVLVHCGEGHGRAPTMAGLARYALAGVPMDEVRRDATHYHFHHLVRHPLRRQQRDFLDQWAATHPQGAAASHR